MKILLLTMILTSSAVAGQPPIKKSGTGNCYDVNYSIKYDRIKNYTPYATMEQCISSGGRKAKGTFA